MQIIETENRHQYYLALIPPVATFCLYTFEHGRFMFLGIPGEFVEIGLNRIVSLLSGIIFSSLIIFLILVFSIRLQEKKSKLARYFGLALLVFLFVSPITLVSRPTMTGLVITLIAVMGAVIGLAEDDSSPNLEKERKDTGGIYPFHVGMAIYGFLYLSLLFFVFGHYMQRTTTKWIVLKEHPNAVFIGTYNGQYILKKVSWEKGVLVPGFFLVPAEKVVEVYDVNDQELSGNDFYKDTGR